MNFANEIFNVKPGSLITVYFRNGSSAEYTTNIWGLLVTDPTVECITSAETGEILFER